MRLITAKNLEKIYNDRVIFSGLNFSINVCDIFVITGKSGSGKTSLLNIMSTLDRNFIGEITINDIGIKNLNGSRLFNFRNSIIGIIFQSNNLLNEFTVYENIVIPALICNSQSNYKKKAFELIEKVGIDHCYNKYPHQLSGGEAQRAAICRSLINSPQIIFADEPTGNLDNINELKILSLVREIATEYSVTFIISSHSSEVIKIATQNLNLST